MRQKRAEETRKRILDAALINFSRFGYDGVSVSEICSEAGVTKGAFYHHFLSKQGLFLEIIEGWLSQLDKLLDKAQSDTETVPRALEKMASQTHLIKSGSKELLPLFLEFWNRALRDQQVWEMTISPYRRYNDYFSALLRKGIVEGSIQPINPEVTGRLIVAMSLGFILQGLMDPTQNWDDAMNEALISFIKSFSTVH